MVELMVGMTVGSIVIAGGLTFYISTTQHQSELIGTARFEQELRDVMQLITSDVRRAGYGALLPNADNNRDGVADANDLIFNPFLAAGHDLATGAKDGETAASCITFTYNLDEETPPSVGACNGCDSLPGAFTTSAPFSAANLPYDRNNVEMFGFRLNAGKIESRSGLNGSVVCLGDAEPGSAGRNRRRYSARTGGWTGQRIAQRIGERIGEWTSEPDRERRKDRH